MWMTGQIGLSARLSTFSRLRYIVAWCLCCPYVACAKCLQRGAFLHSLLGVNFMVRVVCRMSCLESSENCTCKDYIVLYLCFSNYPLTCYRIMVLKCFKGMWGLTVKDLDPFLKKRTSHRCITIWHKLSSCITVSEKRTWCNAHTHIRWLTIYLKNPSSYLIGSYGQSSTNQSW